MTTEELNTVTNAEKIAELSQEIFTEFESDKCNQDVLRDLIFTLHQTIYPGRWATAGR